jgi:hypothetical protein
MRTDFARLDELNTQLLLAQRLTAITLHVLDDRIRLHLALTLLEPELQRMCILANRFVHDLYRPDGPIYETDAAERALQEHATDRRMAEERRSADVALIGPAKPPAA